MRVLHFSDVHIGVPPARVAVGQWLGKRAIGGANLLRGRGRRFARAREKLRALDRFRVEQGVDLVAFSGDYTALGLEPEFLAARRAVEPLAAAPQGYVNVPGNHDLYVSDTVRERRFERHFGEWTRSDLAELCVDGPWPFVRLAGDTVAVVAVNSARPNPAPWRSSGLVPQVQLDGLRCALEHDSLAGRFVLVLTHYAPRLADGRPDTTLHGLVNADALLAACAGLRRGAILCGHVHHAYCLRLPDAPVPVVCAGSATMEGRENLWLLDVDDRAASARRGTWTEDGYRLADEEPHPL